MVFKIMSLHRNTYLVNDRKEMKRKRKKRRKEDAWKHFKTGGGGSHTKKAEKQQLVYSIELRKEERWKRTEKRHTPE